MDGLLLLNRTTDSREYRGYRVIVYIPTETTAWPRRLHYTQGSIWSQRSKRYTRRSRGGGGSVGIDAALLPELVSWPRSHSAWMPRFNLR